MKSGANKIIANGESKQKENIKLVKKLLHLPVEQKACLFVLFIGILGTVVGGIGAEVEMRRCAADKQCSMVNTPQKSLDGIEKAAFVGMGAAVFSSLPALLKRFSE